MDVEPLSLSSSLVKCSDCGCTCSLVMNKTVSGTWFRSVKRKFDEHEEESKFVIPGFSLPHVVRVDVENEVAALREMVSSQQETIEDLSVELEEERNASASAANEAMSMILRLQREKAEIQMELRQFKRFTEDKTAHDQQEILALEDLLYKKEQAIQSLMCEVQAYKHRMLSYGLPESEADGEGGSGSHIMGGNSSSIAVDKFDGQFVFPAYNYPPLKCHLHENHADPEVNSESPYDIEKYAFGETPRSRDHLKDLEYRICQLERSPRSIPPEGETFGTKNVLEKVIVGQSPRRPRHLRKVSTDSAGAFLKEMGPEFSTDSPRFGNNLKKTENSQAEDYSNLRKVDNTSEAGDDMSDRVYTIDSVHQGVPYSGVMEPKASVGLGDDYITTPRGSLNHTDVVDPEIQKLYMRLHALEADRESMRQTIISMRTDKAQLILLKEIAQHLCKEPSPPRRAPVTKPSILVKAFSFMSIFKWIISFIFWKKARQCRYMFGLSPRNSGLLMLLDKGPRVGRWRCLSRTQI